MAAIKSYHLGFWDKLRRALWNLVHLFVFRLSPRTAHGWRCFWLRRFGAQISGTCLVYNSVTIWAPWNLVLQDGAVLGDDVIVYNVAQVRLQRGAIVSQGAYLCTASHDYENEEFPLIAGDIVIGKGAWVATQAFIGPGVSVGTFSLVGARSVAIQDVKPNIVVAGNPARYVKPRPSVDILPGYALNERLIKEE